MNTAIILKYVWPSFRIMYKRFKVTRVHYDKFIIIVMRGKAILSIS